MDNHGQSDMGNQNLMHHSGHTLKLIFMCRSSVKIKRLCQTRHGAAVTANTCSGVPRLFDSRQFPLTDVARTT